MRIVLVATGGTIASRRRGADGLVADVSGGQLLAGLAPDALPDGVDVDVVDVGTRGSYSLTLSDMREIARVVLAQLEQGAQGAVVTHGTDSLEETAFLLDLLHGGDEPVVVTGAQRPFDSADPDGPGNLAAALRAACAPEHAGRGVLVAFAGRVLPARGVRKVETSALAAFAAPEQPTGGSTARSGRSTVRSGRSTARSTIAAAGAPERLPDVAVVAAVPGGDGRATRDALRHDPAGLVFQAVGIGNASPEDVAAVAEAVAAGVPVLVTSRVARGAVAPVYGGSGGGGVALEQAGAVFAGDLTTWQARVLLSLAAALDPQAPLDIVCPWLEDHL